MCRKHCCSSDVGLAMAWSWWQTSSLIGVSGISLIASECLACSYLWTVKKRMHNSLAMPTISWDGGKGIFDLQEKGVLQTRLLGSQLSLPPRITRSWAVESNCYGKINIRQKRFKKGRTARLRDQLAISLVIRWRHRPHIHAPCMRHACAIRIAPDKRSVTSCGKICR